MPTVAAVTRRASLAWLGVWISVRPGSLRLRVPFAAVFRPARTTVFHDALICITETGGLSFILDPSPWKALSQGQRNSPMR